MVICVTCKKEVDRHYNRLDECKGCHQTRFLNAIREWCGAAVFDIAFAGLIIDSSSSTRFHQRYWDLVNEPGEAPCQKGDCVYFAHVPQSADEFRDLAKKNGKGGAAAWTATTC